MLAEARLATVPVPGAPTTMVAIVLGLGAVTIVPDHAWRGAAASAPPEQIPVRPVETPRRSA